MARNGSTSLANVARDRRGRVLRTGGWALQQIRRRWFALHPLCVECLGADPPRIRVAVELDHKVPLHLGGVDADSNRQGLCRPCHAAKTNRELGHAAMRGCDADGRPLDATHHWHQPTPAKPCKP
jgi:5-methylcytosine-specific restriction endonuclease McrA